MNNILALNPPVLIKRYLIFRWKFNLRIVLVLSFIIIGFLLSFYIFQMIEVAEIGFSVSNHKKEIATLSQEDKNLEINFSQTNSLANLETILNKFNYEKVEKIHYIRVLGEQVAARPQ